jgi:hypothetical protein
VQRRGGSKGPGATQSAVVSNRQSDLGSMRTLLLAAIKTAAAPDLPRICRELRAVNAELEALAPSLSTDQQFVDQLKARRVSRARRSAT